jgi:hypothetical protein
MGPVVSVMTNDEVPHRLWLGHLVIHASTTTATA